MNEKYQNISPEIQWNIILWNIRDECIKTNDFEKFKEGINFVENQSKKANILLRHSIVTTIKHYFYDNLQFKEYAIDRLGKDLKKEDLIPFLKFKENFIEFKEILRKNKIMGIMEKAYRIRDEHNLNHHQFKIFSGFLIHFYHYLRIFGVHSIYLDHNNNYEYQQEPILGLKVEGNTIYGKIMTNEEYSTTWWKNPSEIELCLLKIIEYQNINKINEEIE